MTGRRHWGVIYVEPGAERTVSDRLLDEQDARTYWPKHTEDTRRGKIRDPVPWYPRYVFADLRTVQSIAKVCEVPGVYDFIRFQERIALVSSKTMLEIRRWEAMGEHMPTAIDCGLYEIGDHVQFTEYPYTEQSGEVVWIGDGSVRLEINGAKVTVSQSNLKLIEKCA